VIAPDGSGFCRVRRNVAGRLYAEVYGRACARNVDPVEKKPFFHVYPGSRSYSIATVGCNFTCRFCQNWDIAMAGPDDVAASFHKPAGIVQAALAAGCRTISYTYSEPTVFYEYMRDCAREGRDRGVASLMVSNGFINEEPQRQLLPLLRAVKIDLKSFSEEFYDKVCGGRLQPVLDSLLRLRDHGIWYEIVVLIIPGLNDGRDEIRRMTEWIVRELGPDVPVHFSRYHPSYRMRNIPATPPSLLRQCRDWAREQGCRFVYLGNLPGDDAQHTFCPDCGKVLIRRQAYHIMQNNIQQGRCDACGCVIPGVWT
ncbi:MAG: AmmeMemoRadiSam system radical SAM enzyme, partial [Lentisphaerae bacterium]|nr:AmmeMemoRadiSam system radical SAM enzyme [Lentisphaerota bacterium]